MARPDRLTVLRAIEAQGVLPLFFDPDPEVCVGVIAACARAGAPCVEVTDRGDFVHAAFLETARHFAATDPHVMLGVGSVPDAPTAALFLSAGARFVVSPLLNPEIARLCNRRHVPYLPGCGSVRDIGEAHELGCEIVKLFPAGEVGGPSFISAVRGPMPWTKVLPTGGVEPEEASLRPWFAAGAVAVGMGSRLIDARAVKARDYAAVEAAVRRAVEAVRRLRDDLRG